jgi:hypothetical protein
VTFNRLCELFDDGTIDKIAAGSTLLGISGEIKYTDVFGASYMVTCGGKYSPNLQAMVADETKIKEY